MSYITDQYKSYVWPIFSDFRGWNPLEYFWLALALLLVAIGSMNASQLEFAAALTNVLCVIQVAKGRMSNYYWGLAGVILYAIVAYKQQFYGNAILNAIYIPFQFWGLYEWRKALDNSNKSSFETHDDVAVKRLTPFKWGVVGVVFAVVFYSTWRYFDHIEDAAPVLDAATLTLSLIAMTLMVRQYSEQWLLWIAVNIISIYMWVIPALDKPGSWAMVAMWSVFLINSLYGAYKWYFVKTGK